MAKSVTVFEISQVIGKDMTQKLIEEYGGMSCYLSTDPMALEFPGKPEKHEYIKNLFYNSGKSVNEIAEKVGMSIDHIRKIINER
jgi:Mor family transcriptional regulator